MHVAYIGEESEQEHFINTCREIVTIRNIKCFHDIDVFLTDSKKETFALIFLELTDREYDIAKAVENITIRDKKTEVVLIAENESLAFNAFRAGAFGYFLKSYEKKDVLRVVGRYVRKGISQDEKVFIKTFGRFDVFKGNRVIYFSNKKSKELLAMLVDRHGGCVSMEQIIDNLWEERAFDECTKSLYRIALKNLRDTLEGEGCAYILKERRGQRSINIDEVVCDYFEFLKNPEAMATDFNGEYMTDYAWGEYTLANLMEKSKKNF